MGKDGKKSKEKDREISKKKATEGGDKKGKSDKKDKNDAHKRVTGSFDGCRGP